MQNKPILHYITNYALQAYGLRHKNMRILQRKLNAKIVKNGGIQLDYVELQQFVKYVQINITHICTIAMPARRKKKNILIAF
jgi:hypothetical protein